MECVGPLSLRPRFLEKIWGATHLEPWFSDSQVKIGEVWLEADRPLPLLVKFLFTTGKLSVQVHPGDAYAALHHHSPGKTEMWHVLRAEPGSQIAAGFREPITKERIAAAARSGEIENLLQWFDARPGDTFFLPAGTVHAIGAGLVMCEIQQNSDITYRLYDYGRPRELHLDAALAVSHLGQHHARVEPQGDVLLRCEYFTVRRLELDRAIQYSPAAAGEFLISIDGCGEAWYAPPGTAPFELPGPAIWLAAAIGAPIQSV